MDDGQPERRTGLSELERNVVPGGCGPMLSGQSQLGAFAAQIEIGVAPAVQFTGPAQSLSRPAGVGVFAGVMHQQDGQLELSLELP